MPITIHHTTKKSAEKQGVLLEVDGSTVRAFIPKNGTAVFGVSGQDALKQVLAAQELFTKSSENVRYRHGDDPKIRGKLEKNGKTGNAEPSITEGTPVELLALWEAGTIEWDDAPVTIDWDEKLIVDNIEDTLPDGGPNSGFVEDEHPKEPAVDSRPVIRRAENGVALDGAVAYREGITAADCP